MAVQAIIKMPFATRSTWLSWLDRLRLAAFLLCCPGELTRLLEGCAVSLGGRHQATMDLRGGSPADERRARCSPLEGRSCPRSLENSAQLRTHTPMQLCRRLQAGALLMKAGLFFCAKQEASRGSETIGNTTGTVRVACSNGPTAEAPWARMTSGASAANSAACLRISAALAVDQRMSICTLRPMVQPDC